MYVTAPLVLQISHVQITADNSLRSVSHDSKKAQRSGTSSNPWTAWSVPSSRLSYFLPKNIPAPSCLWGSLWMPNTSRALTSAHSWTADERRLPDPGLALPPWDGKTGSRTSTDDMNQVSASRRQRNISVWRENVRRMMANLQQKVRDRKSQRLERGSSRSGSLRVSSGASWCQHEAEQLIHPFVRANRPAWSKARSLFQATQHGMSSFTGTPPLTMAPSFREAQQQTAVFKETVFSLNSQSVNLHLKKKKKKSSRLFQIMSPNWGGTKTTTHVRWKRTEQVPD